MSPPSEWSTSTLGRKSRSKTGCRTCRIRKVKCDEEKLIVAGQEEPQCRRCAVARIRCEWHGGPIPRRRPAGSTRPKKGQAADTVVEPSSSAVVAVPVLAQAQAVSSPLLAPLRPVRDQGLLQAANSLALSGVDRSCLDYLQDSALVVLLGKHWPWSTLSYAYHRVAVREPMVMSMILASTASEIHRARCHADDSNPTDPRAARGRLVADDLSAVDGRQHYGRALSALRAALKHDVKSPARIEAIFITLWLMIDYENRFGNGVSAINIHIRGVETLLHQHVVPLLQHRQTHQHQHQQTLSSVPVPAESPSCSSSTSASTPTATSLISPPDPSSSPSAPPPGAALQRTSVPLFLLWTLYFYTPAAVFHGANGPPPLDSELFRFFFRAESDPPSLGLADLYKISRQSPSRFWGEDYPTSMQLDDMENMPGLTLYHRAHVVQFRITELFQNQRHASNTTTSGDSSTSSRRSPDPEVSSNTPKTEGFLRAYQRIVAELVSISDEYDTLLSSAQSAPSVEVVPAGRRVMETIFWSAITYYSSVVYFYLCLPMPSASEGDHNLHQLLGQLLPPSTAVSRVLELALKLHRSRPRLMLRIVWPLFIAGVATRDQIYQDWVSIRLRELRRYGQNFERVSVRFDEVIRGGGDISFWRGGSIYI